MRTCIFPGTFDPITYGHLDVLQRAIRLFDRVVIGVARNPGKGPLFTAERRVDLIQPSIAALPNVSVKIFEGLMVDFAEQEGAVAVIRGLRAFSDFEFEFNMALMNRHLKGSIEAVFVMPNENFSYTSSSLVKQVARHGGGVSKFVPPNVAEALAAVYAST